MAIIVIPARLKSSRLEEKLLQDVNGKPLIQRTYENVLKSGFKIIIATDDEKILKVCEKFNAQVCLTSNTHQSGTTRISEVIEKMNIVDDEIIINVQGDEPLLPSELINQVVNCLGNSDIATLKEQIFGEDIFNENCVKVVTDKNNNALYFSRASIPFQREKIEIFKHIGLYAYRVKTIKKIVKLPMSELENVEKLEQLTPLYNGFKIKVETAIKPSGIGIDTIEDLQKLKEILK
ncbi:3-deoxy-manno-octulosonate cytidylyltransferase [hydrothermal vent metagenome]|uniref:3-deoxy-manno-octulosonate cytidylyltransferase n=1 Tax=hydrothermal vent metagenome TaxID=652676 RepID=A0A1W1CUE9_9ZZZZ